MISSLPRITLVELEETLNEMSVDQKVAVMGDADPVLAAKILAGMSETDRAAVLAEEDSEAALDLMTAEASLFPLALPLLLGPHLMLPLLGGDQRGPEPHGAGREAADAP
jgi:hypothetical protein